MTDKVAIDRETLERVLDCLVEEGRSLHAAEVREALEQKVEPDEQEAALQKIADFGQDQEPVAWMGLPGKGTPLYAAPPAPAAVPSKLWLWKNFVDGRPEYWAFDNPFPVHMDYGDPQTLGEPCGYAIFKPSRQGRTDVGEAEVLRRIAAAKEPHDPRR